jgi:hypothetical protein
VNYHLVNMAEQTVGQRISQVIAHLGISKNAFAASLEKTATVIQHLVDERNKPGFDLLCKIFEVYPNVSKDWLLQGQGSMLTDAAATVPRATPASTNPEKPATAKEPRPLSAPITKEPASAQAVAPLPPAPTLATEVPTTPAPVAATVAPAPNVAIAPPAAPVPVADPNASLQAALYAQQLAHQLALAEMRNQHLQEQQRLMQQMMEMMQRQFSKQ